MATQRDIAAAQAKLKVKSELLQEKVKQVKAAENVKRLKAQLRSMGGRVRV